ncbi:MAG: enoyl-CoA hydratase/isomerase family protein [Bdellovibrionales bacterium]|nr:enoyl-CoA hydratase/isomerase family protein [Bdellovibrionales bacterium]
MIEEGTLETLVENGIGTIVFGHPKSNSLPGSLLRKIAEAVREFSRDQQVRVVLLKSEGNKAFCAGASFDELLSVKTLEESEYFFGGFAEVVLALRDCPKVVVARVQGKVVGGGVGVISACDYVLATENASVKLSEIALGIGPFIIGPPVERKVGKVAYAEMGLDADWRDAAWAKAHGLFVETYPDVATLDVSVAKVLEHFASANPEALYHLKTILWKETEHWKTLVPERVKITAKLALTDFVQRKVQSFKQGGS